MKKPFLPTMLWLSTAFLPLWLGGVAYAEDGVTDSEIVIGGVMDLEGRASALGTGMKIGIEAALKDKAIGSRKLVFKSHNDSYTPAKTVEETKKLIGEGVFIFAGNMGTPTAKVSLPLLAEKKIPAVGFYTGGSFLRGKQEGIVNYRASYAQETQAIVTEALKQGVAPQAICAYAQNDEFGMEGVKGIRAAFEGVKGADAIRESLDKALAMTGEDPARNNVAPLGVYTRNTFIARDAYDSLKNWEKKQGTACKLIVSVGVYEPTSRFIAYAQQKGEKWSYSAISATSAVDFLSLIKRFAVNTPIIMTQITPPTDSDLPIVKDAHTALGNDYNTITQEGYIVGRLVLYALQKLDADGKPITRQNFMQTLLGQHFDLGGLDMNFTDDNQASDFIAMTNLTNGNWVSMQSPAWSGWPK